MKNKFLRDDFGTVAIIALSIMLVMIALAMVAVSCLFSDHCERAGLAREDTAEQVTVTFDCPLTVRAIDTCPGQKRHT